MSASATAISHSKGHASVGETSARDIRERAQAVAAVAAVHADSVDRAARFPSEAIAALREQRLLGMMIPAEFGGEGATPSEVADVCYILGGVCASSAMIFAMHSVKIGCIARHSRGAQWHERLQRRIAAEQWLVASSTTEGNNGGNIRSSAAAVETSEARIALDRDASVISYGEDADALVTTARRDAAAGAGDQVLLALTKDDYTLERTGSWDTLGMRGTCSRGYALRAQGLAEQILPEPYERIHARTMMPFAHLFWSSVWAGVAAGAMLRARAFVRKAARASGGQLPPAAAHLTRARAQLETLRGRVQSALALVEAHAPDDEAFGAMDVQLALNLLKVEVSEGAVATVLSAMRACGLAGYRNDGEFSMGRALRDILSAPIMINNDRILADAGAAALLSEAPAFLGRP